MKTPMKVEIRADSVLIEGYVNATEKRSKPIITPHGRVIEEIQPGAFAQALSRAPNVTLQVDHDGKDYASTEARTLELREDAIGLHARTTVTDADVIRAAHEGKIKGWSFGMNNIVDALEQRGENEPPLRRINSLDLDHVSLIIRKNPAYNATSVEVRADEAETTVEERGIQVEVTTAEATNLQSYKDRIKKL